MGTNFSWLSRLFVLRVNVMKRNLIGVLVIGALVVGGATWNASRDKPVDVELTTVKRGEIRATVSNTRAGTVDACERARMSTIKGGQIAVLAVKEGDQVKKDQVLLELWNDDLKAQLSLANEERIAAIAHADEACAAAAVASREADRFENLRSQQLASEERADIASGEASSRAAACRAMKSMVKVSDAKIQMAKAYLDETILKAPFSGTVAEINGELGEIVTPSPVGVATLPTVDLIDNSCIYISAPIDEVDAPAIRAGMKATISLDAFPNDEFPATIRRVAPYVFAVEKQARTLTVEAEFDLPSEDLLPGYSADVEVTLAVHPDVLFIPSQAIIDDNTVLLMDEGGVLRAQEVVTGLRNWQTTEIVSGLEEHQEVVLSVNREGVFAGVSANRESALPQTDR